MCGLGSLPKSDNPSRLPAQILRVITEGVVMPKKQCSQCGEIKSYSEFHKGKRYVGGVESACKVCRSLNGKKRYQQKREHILAVAKAWKDAHPDQCREMVRKRRREKVEAVRIWQRAYYASNPERYRKAAREWAKRNRDKVRARNKAQRARRRGAKRSGAYTFQDWQAVMERYGYCCAYCGEKKPLTQDHIIPLSRGGAHSTSNIVPACSSCNSRKNKRTPEEAGINLRRI